MHLSKMKLAGFKSFVDPTTIHFPSSLVAVVGPNGCGKSNVIDAVSWVMGESSPKYLRGESSTDVIFTGSTARKAIGQASVELVFDNHDAALGGEYAQYAEISIKRVINRVDGEEGHSDSSYYLNGARCRKRDITDLFLGTGLGARSYSIIGQNMIAKITDAKPDELRSYLEEAAGISKYKERRHETNLRVQHTKDNLARVNDVRAELDKQLSHLEQQAKTAEKYKLLKQDERRLKAESWALQWRDLDSEMVNLTLEIQREETMLESQQSMLVKIESSLDTSRHEQRAANDSLQAVQKRYYAVANDVTRVEQEVLYHQEKTTQWQHELQSVSADLEVQQELLTVTEQDVVQSTHLLEELQPEREALQEQFAEIQQQLSDLETEQEHHQHTWDDFVQASARTMQTAQLEKNNSEHLDRKVQSLMQRKEQLDAQLQSMQGDETQDGLELFQEKQEQLDACIEDQETLSLQLQERIHSTQHALQAAQTQREQLMLRMQQYRGRETSLEALQQAARGASQNSPIESWLQQHHLDQHTRLVNHLKVDPIWSAVVENVLGLCLQAVCMEEFTVVGEDLSQLQNGNVCLLKASSISASATHPGIQAPFLAEKIQSSFPVDDILRGIYAVETVQMAMEIQPHLQQHESVVSADGFWLGASWIKALKSQDPTSGVLQRAEELTVLRAECEACDQAVQQFDEQCDNIKNTLLELEEQRETVRKKLNDLKQSRAQLQAESRATIEKHKLLAQHRQVLQKENQDLCVQITEVEQQWQQAKDHWQQALSLLDNEADERHRLQHHRDQYQQRIRTLRDQVSLVKDKLHQLTLRFETTQSTLRNQTQNSARIKQQLGRLQEREQHVREELSLLPEMQSIEDRLSQLLEQHVRIEGEMNTTKSVVDTLAEEHHQIEKNKQEVEKSIERVRSNLESFRVAWQGVKVNTDHILQQFSDASVSLEETLPTLRDDADYQKTHRELEQVSQRIQRLGAINLIAIEEYASCLERKQYLDQQVADLDSALQMLDDAIAKIDRETKQRFQDTFQQVNNYFSELFPTVFGGGKAYLELTSEDLLAAGVTMMACPPGKRNSTIYLLSGGEKSLTALAFIFSIFRLNPAPFCLLDEVDAALDDTNVMRFCRLITTMSQRTQFIYISHNKIAIEAAKHLMGVTMHEPGVSRLVSVDVQKAIDMVQL